MHETDTIAAISTAPGQAGIAIIRLSGPDSFHIADAVFEGRRRPSELAPNSFAHGSIRNGDEDAAAVDEVVLLAYRAPHSYTREDVVEIQGHGGRAAAGRILQQLLAHGARPAEPGEFTRRAFLSGRIDLLQAEAVADLIGAKSERAASAAMDQLSGSLSLSCNSIYDRLVVVAADLEASFDFAEEELPETVIPRLAEELGDCRVALESLLTGWQEGRLLREGALVVITGKPNVGKSTLMNRLLGSERAIVASAPGTTRDTIEEGFVLGDIPLRLVDTAGLRETDCEIEREGVRRAVEKTDEADLRLHVLDISQELMSAESAMLDELPADRTILVLNKCDLPQALAEDSLPHGLPRVRTSLAQDAELSELLDSIKTQMQDIEERPPHAVISSRHKAIVQSALNEMNRSLGHLADDEDPVLAAQALRQSLELLGRITGREYSQELLDSIFSRFCIGK